MFASKFCVLNPSLSLPTLPSHTQLFLDSVSFSANNVESLLSNLNSDSATGPDGISTCVLKTCSAALAHPLSVLFTFAFAHCHLPSAWKSANNTTLQKTGAETDPCNYRPISLLPIISTVMESIIASDIKSFLFSNGLISDHQFGFRPGYSTLDMLLLLFQQWMEIFNARSEIRAISLDISHAFDMFWPPSLLTKLSSYGIQGHLHSWLIDFLSCVALNGVLSSPLPVQAGVPQGSALGSVLFLVFINDLTLLENPLYLFADDSTLHRAIFHPSDRQAAASSPSAHLDKITS